jgi:multicomponent Na+:H+ antiporter subunit C
MSTVTLFGLCAAALVGLGLYGALTHPHPLRKLIAFNLLGNFKLEQSKLRFNVA